MVATLAIHHLKDFGRYLLTKARKAILVLKEIQAYKVTRVFREILV